ncbi:MAG: Asp23/Gls24 family envelope stress response protein [Chlamydiales bacterium]
MKESPTKLDTKEFEVPKTVFSHDIETRVIQVIILQCLNKVEGVSLMGGTLIDTLFGRDGERVKGIFVEQDSKNHLVKVKIEVNVQYGISIPEKMEEVQARAVEEITKLTGLHVSSVHVIVKGLISPQEKKEEYSLSLLSGSEIARELNK